MKTFGLFVGRTGGSYVSNDLGFCFLEQAINTLTINVKPGPSSCPAGSVISPQLPRQSHDLRHMDANQLGLCGL